MASSKRPSQNTNPDPTVMIGGDSDEDLVSTSAKKLRHDDVAADEPMNDGATAFVRVDQVPQDNGYNDGAGDTVRNPPPAAEDDAAGATAFVRLDHGGPPAAPIPRRPGAQPKGGSAPKRGLQVQLPDDEPPPAPKPKPKPAPAPAGKKGRRGAWWDEEAAKVPDEPEPQAPPELPPEPEPDPEHDGATAMYQTGGESEDDAQGATAFVPGNRNRARQAEPEPEIEAPKRKKVEEPEVYRPVAADDYEGHLGSGPPKWKVWLRRAVVLAIVFTVLGAGALIGGYVYIVRKIPPFESVRDYKPMVATQVIADDGTVIGQFYKEKRTVVKMEQIPRVLVNAVLSAEDKDFYKHGGVNPIAMARAVVTDVLSGRRRVGASTITQQVVKNFFLSSEKTLSRKVKEILLAQRLESNLSKDDILYLYLNQINFGRAHYGVEQASLYYFGKHVQDLELGEAALLAGLQQNPTRLNPRRHPENAKRRQTYVLGRMLANKYITKDDYDREVEKPLALPPPPEDPPGAWYLDEVKRRLVEQFGEGPVETAGYTVEVPMNPRLQQAAEIAVQEGLRAVDKRQGFRGPIFKIDAASLGDFSAALARRLASSAAGDKVLVADLANVQIKDALSGGPPAKGKGAKGKAKQADEDDSGDAPEADSSPQVSDRATPEQIAHAAEVRVLEQNGVYAGVVTGVNSREARVMLAPGVEGPVPFQSMTWARPFKPESRTPSPDSPRDVLNVGDVVAVRVATVNQVRVGNQQKVRSIELWLEQTPEVQGAFAAIDLKSRYVLSLVGGFDIRRSQFNRATQAKRQPGSAFKPFLYAAAFESARYTPSTRVDDSPEVITDPWSGKPWKPQNFEKDEFDGPISMRKALAESKNTVAVKLLIDLGLDKVRSQALSAGLTSSIPQSYTAALGTGEVGVLEIINAYATLGSLGRKADPVFIKKVTSRDGTVLFRNETVPEQSMRADTAYITADVMRSVIDDNDGTAHSLKALGRSAAGKTGTASEHRDGWFIGFTPSVVAGAWVGFDDHKMMGALETGGHCAGPIWLQWMRAATLGAPLEDWPPPPPGVVEARVNRNTGEPAGPDDPQGVREVYLQGTEPKFQEGTEQQPPPDQQGFEQQ